MKCPACHKPSTVIETRQKKQGVVRRRECINMHRFTSIEIELRRPEKKTDKALPKAYLKKQQQRKEK